MTQALHQVLAQTLKKHLAVMKQEREAGRPVPAHMFDTAEELLDATIQAMPADSPRAFLTRAIKAAEPYLNKERDA